LGEEMQMSERLRHVKAGVALTQNVNQLKDSGDQLFSIMEGYLEGLKDWPLLSEAATK
jgi:hypothetical protein